MSNIKQIHTFERLLELWQDLWWLYVQLRNTAIEFGKNPKHMIKTADFSHQDLVNKTYLPLTYWPNFRAYLNQQREYTGTADARFLSGTDFWQLDTIAQILSRWSLSKKIFCLESNLQLLLQSAPITGIKWSEIVFPFNTFAIKLAEPIVYRQRKFDCLAIEKTPSNRILIIALPAELSEYATISQVDRFYIPYYIQGGYIVPQNEDPHHPGAAAQIMDRINPRWQLARGWPNMTVNNLDDIIQQEINPEQVVASKHSPVDQEALQVMSQLLRTLTGVCMYLQNYKNTSTVQSVTTEKTVAPNSDGQQAITANQEVLSVSFGQRVHLTDESRLLLREETKALNEEASTPTRRELTKPHPRRSHWRRLPGYGNDPHGPRRLIPAVTVRADLLKSGIALEGSATMLQ